MPAVSEKPVQAHPARQKALAQFLTKLRSWNDSSADDEAIERSARITVGTRTVTLEPWERQQLSDWFAAEESALPAARYLLAHGAALMLKSCFDIERLIREADDSSTNMYALQAELMLDTAIGMALLKDIQRATDGLVKTGQFEDAKCLTQFRHRLAHVVNDAKMCIAESEREQAESIASSLTDQPEPEPSHAQPSLMAPVAGASATMTAEPPQAVEGAAVEVVTSDVTAPTPVRDLSQAIAADGSAMPIPRRRPRPRRRPPIDQASVNASGPSLTQILAGLCLLTGAAWFAASQVPALLVDTPGVMTRGEFAADLPIVSVESHAPSVFVTIETADWSVLEADARADMIQELGRAAAREGFSGLLLRSDRGVPLAHWLVSRGASEIMHGEEGPGVAGQEPPPVVEFETLGSGH